jgi:hypothetical protein
MRKLWGLSLLFLLALSLSSCADRLYSDKTVIEWSRGRRVGVAAQSEPIAMAVTPDGQRIVMAWVASPERGTTTLHLVTLDAQGSVLTDVDLPLTVNEPQRPRLVLAGDNQLHLVWSDRDEDEVHALYHAQLTEGGGLVSERQQLSRAGFRVNGHAIAALPSGELLVVWSDREGLTAARIDETGSVQHSELMEAPDTSQLDLQVGQGSDSGLVHVVWQQSPSAGERRISYTTLDPSSLAFSWPIYLTTVMIQSTTSSLGGSAEELIGPVLAMDPEQIIVSWTVGETRGSDDDVYFVSFVPGEPKELFPRQVALPPLYQPDYVETRGAFPYRQLAGSLPQSAARNRASLRSAPATIAGEVEEVPLAIGVWVRTQWSPQLQPALVVLDEGKVKGYQVVNWSRYPSLHPTLSADADDNLYLAWIDAAGKTYPVYVATTAPSPKALWDTVTQDDLLVTLEQLFGRTLSAFGLVFVGLSWLILPGFFLIVALFVFREDSLSTSRGQIVFLVLVGLHWTGKYLFTPEFLTSLPKMSDLSLIFPLLPILAPETFAYLPNQLGLPPFVAPLIPYIVPGLTLIAGAIVTRLLYLRRKHANLVPAYLILAIVDVILALQIYALTYYDPIKF